MPKKWKEQSLGSGVIVSPDGYIITNNHVIEQADEIRVTLFDKTVFQGQDLSGLISKTDVAVVKIDAKDLPTVRWGDSDKLQVGEFVLAIGNPLWTKPYSYHGDNQRRGEGECRDRGL